MRKFVREILEVVHFQPAGRNVQFESWEKFGEGSLPARGHEFGSLEDEAEKRGWAS